MAALPLCPLSLSWPLDPVLPPVCSPSLVLTCPPSQVPWSLALGVSVLVFPLPSRHTFRGATREAPLPLPLHLAAPWRPGSVCTAARGPLLPPYLPLPPLPLPLSILTFCPYAGHFVGKSHACRRHASGPSLPALPFPLSSLRTTLRRTLCRHVACMSQARTWPSFCDSTRGGPLRGNAPRRPALSSAPALCGRLARRWGTFVLPPHARSFMPPWHAPCPALQSLPLCPPASTSTMRSNSRGSAPSLPPLSALAPWPCSAPCLLALPCPLVPPSQVPWSLALGVSVPVLPLPSRHTLRGTIREAPLPLPLHLAAPWRPGSVRTGPQPAALYSRPTSPSLPCPFPSLHSAGHFVGMPHACRRHTPGPSLPALPCPLSTLCRTLRRTLCWHFARMSQARTWPLLAASSGGLAQRCDRPPLPQPPQEPPPQAATPNAAGGAALVGPGCPPARVSLYPPRRLVAGGDPSQISARHRKK